MLNATWLETFTTLCEIGHFTRAAEMLGMTQPGVSQQLRKLEAQVGKPLISQDGKSFSLTPAGEAVLAVGQARRAQERALREGVAVDDPDVGQVSLGCSGSFATWIYPHLLARMQVAPELVLRVTAAPQASVVAGVLDGSIDLGVVAQQPEHPRLQAIALAKEELCLVVPLGFAGTQLQDLDALGFVAHPDGYAYADDLFTSNFPEQYQGADRLRVRTFINQIGQIPSPVAQGVGYTILPKSGVAAFHAPDALRVLPLPVRRFQQLWLISRQGRSQFARIAAIRDLIARAVVALG